MHSDPSRLLICLLCWPPARARCDRRRQHPRPAADSSRATSSGATVYEVNPQASECTYWCIAAARWHGSATIM